MNKRKILSFLVVVCIGLMLTSCFCINHGVANSFYFSVFEFKADKTEYYSNETILLSAKWELNYDEAQEISCMQLIMHDTSSNVLWKSEKYFGIGIEAQNWSIQLCSLSFTTALNQSLFQINFFNYYMNLNIGIPEIAKLDTIEIWISEALTQGQDEGSPSPDNNHGFPSYVLFIIAIFSGTLLGVVIYGLEIILRRRKNSKNNSTR